MEHKRIGLVLTAGIESQQTPHYGLPTPPDAQGRYRAEAGAYLFATGAIDKLYAVGGMPDEFGYPVEYGHTFYLLQLLDRWKMRNFRGGIVNVLPSYGPRFETIEDLRQAMTALRQESEDQDVTIISHGYHLYPRVLLLDLLEDFNAKLIPAEFIHRKMARDTQFLQRTGFVPTPDPVDYPSQFPREFVLNHLLAWDLVTGTAWGRNWIQAKAQNDRQSHPSLRHIAR